MLKEKEPPREEELFAKAQKPVEEALDLHHFYAGKIQMALKAPIRSFDDFAIWYTPGVAEPCRAIAQDPEQVYGLTNKWNTIAVVSDGTRVLGLGDIGPAAALPVMEGKALLYKYLGGVDAIPLTLDTKDPDEIIRAVKMLQPAFGGVNLEDIAQPKCFRILDTLKAEAEIPIWHDDQQGTATVILAGLLNALKVVGKPLAEVRIAFVGAGAANIACSRLIYLAGADPGKTIFVDSRGILHRNRKDLYQRRAEYPEKWHACLVSNAGEEEGGIPEAMRGADVVIALSRPGPDTIQPEWVRGMADDAIVFACANPTPEIWPWKAKEAGAALVATGRSDFPNQVNNSLVFPGIFRGALDVRAKTISDGMCLAAASALADMALERGLDPDHILPTMEDWEVYPREAAAVAMQAQVEGLARIHLTRQQAQARAESRIRAAREMTQALMSAGFIPDAPEGDSAEIKLAS